MLQNTKKGFTLIELLISLIVIGIISVVCIRMIYNMVSYRSKQFAIEDTSDSFRDFISVLSNQIRESTIIDITDSGKSLKIIGQGCKEYKYSISDKSFKKTEGLGSTCDSSPSDIFQTKIIINNINFSPIGLGVNVVNIEVEGIYKDSLSERPFNYQTTITKRI